MATPGKLTVGRDGKVRGPASIGYSTPFPVDPGREQVYYLGDARRAKVWPADSRIDPAQIRVAVELRQRAEERRRGRISRERSGDIIGQIAALRAFRRQLNDHIIADRDTCIAHPHRAHGEDPSAAARRNRPAHLPAVDRAPDGMLSLGTPYLIWIERNRDHRAAARSGSEEGTEPPTEHGPHRGTIVARRCPPMWESLSFRVLTGLSQRGRGGT
jgi:hypothetical protein